MGSNIKSEMRSFKSNENIHKKEGGSNLSIYLPIRLNPRGGHQTGSGEPSAGGYFFCAMLVVLVVSERSQCLPYLRPPAPEADALPLELSGPVSQIGRSAIFGREIGVPDREMFSRQKYSSLMSKIVYLHHRRSL